MQGVLRNSEVTMLAETAHDKLKTIFELFRGQKFFHPTTNGEEFTLTQTIPDGFFARYPLLRTVIPTEYLEGSAFDTRVNQQQVNGNFTVSFTAPGQPYNAFLILEVPKVIDRKKDLSPISRVISEKDHQVVSIHLKHLEKYYDSVIMLVENVADRAINQNQIL